MKVKIVVVDFEVPPRLRRWGPRLGIPLALILSGASVAYAAGVITWSSGDTLKAADLSSNFSALQAQFPVVSYAEVTGAVVTSGEGNWSDVPGLSLSFTAAAAGHADVYALASISTPSDAASCSMRFVIDATGGPVEADRIFNQPFTAPSTFEASGYRRIAVTAGPHTAKVQISKDAGIFANATCQVGGATYAAVGRLRVEVGP